MADVKKINDYRKQIDNLRTQENQSGISDSQKAKLEAQISQLNQKITAELNGTAKTNTGDANNKANPFQSYDSTTNTTYEDPSANSLKDYQQRETVINNSITDIQSQLAASQKELDSGDLTDAGKTKVQNQINDLQKQLADANEKKKALDEMIKKLQEKNGTSKPTTSNSTESGSTSTE